MKLLGLALLILFNSSIAQAIQESSPVYDPSLPGVKGFMARPDKIDGKTPGVILIHEWWGLNDNIKAWAREFAKRGYIALAVDLYSGEVTKDRKKALNLMKKVNGDIAKAFKNLRAAVQFIKNQPKIDSNRLASIGWCFGGGWSYKMASNQLGVKASIIYYGQFHPSDDLKKMRATILGHFGEEDRGIRVDSVREFQARLKTTKGQHEIYIYKNAGHAFANPESGNYVKAAADQANQRTWSFLKKYL